VTLGQRVRLALIKPQRRHANLPFVELIKNSNEVAPLKGGRSGDLLPSHWNHDG